ncbi:MAG: magnesium transporter [Fimbriimonadaceae bacterium]|jgi:magnesium transporter|nr:magnesium transporter [Fimbriimonadaceae bacterium]
MRTDEKTFVDELRSLAKIEDPEVVREHLEGIRPEDIAEALPRLDVHEGLAILQRMEDAKAADVLVELPNETARAYLDELPDSTVAHYLDILPMDDAIELTEELPPDRRRAILKVIPEEDAQEIERLLAYPDDSVGRLITEDVVEVRPEASTSEILKDLREKPEEEYEMINDIYVLDQYRHLLGVFSLRRLLRADPHQTAKEMMMTDVISVPPEMHEEEAARLIARYGFYALPVIDSRGRMLGIFTVDDAHEILEEADTQDVLALGGVSGDAEAYLSLSVWQVVRRRLPWLLVLFLAEFFTGSVLRHYTKEATGGGATRLAQLMLFVPLLIGAGGNSGSQVTTTMTRALAVGEIKPRDVFVVLRREFVIAVTIGICLGLAGFARAYLGWSSGWNISLIVGLALPAIILWATTVGSVLPLGAKALGIDPAVMSAPFITTFVDATGLVIYFEIARQLGGL